MQCDSRNATKDRQSVLYITSSIVSNKHLCLNDFTVFLKHESPYCIFNKGCFFHSSSGLLVEIKILIHKLSCCSLLFVIFETNVLTC